MTIVGIIAEYNPLHNGHAWHLAVTRQSLAPEAVIVVMSGHFTQRGEPTIVDKWSRASMAIAGGADLVFELPTLYACSRATWFAHGAVSLLSQLGIVTHLSFGSEAGEIQPLKTIAEILEEDPPELRARALELSSLGLPHPAAQAQALSEITGGDHAPKSLATANNILAVEYLRSLMRQQSAIIPWTVKRHGAGYHDLELGPLASATAIRQALLNEGSLSGIMASLPTFTLETMDQQLKHGRAPVAWDSLGLTAMALLRRSSKEQLAELPEVSEGLENRLYELADASSISTWFTSVKTKRYTHARISRSLAHLLLGITKADLAQMEQPLPYARVLAMNDIGRKLLSRCRKSSLIPIIHKPSNVRLSPWGERLLSLDRLATDLWVLGVPNPDERHGAQDLTREPLRFF